MLLLRVPRVLRACENTNEKVLRLQEYSEMCLFCKPIFFFFLSPINGAYFTFTSGPSQICPLPDGTGQQVTTQEKKLKNLLEMRSRKQTFIHYLQHVMFRKIHYTDSRSGDCRSNPELNCCMRVTLWTTLYCIMLELEGVHL